MENIWNRNLLMDCKREIMHFSHLEIIFKHTRLKGEETLHFYWITVIISEPLVAMKSCNRKQLWFHVQWKNTFWQVYWVDALPWILWIRVKRIRICCGLMSWSHITLLLLNGSSTSDKWIGDLQCLTTSWTLIGLP